MTRDHGRASDSMQGYDIIRKLSLRLKATCPNQSGPYLHGPLRKEGNNDWNNEHESAAMLQRYAKPAMLYCLVIKGYVAQLAHKASSQNKSMHTNMPAHLASSCAPLPSCAEARLSEDWVRGAWCTKRRCKAGPTGAAFFAARD